MYFNAQDLPDHIHLASGHRWCWCAMVVRTVIHARLNCDSELEVSM
jgi:hypothetical protein